ncbi:hypothetical protein [Saccharothrix lopnurensis]|uniref:Peptidase inhibitor family I36 n=1 Tax=Saccharothrix lopnurensis TaxID=1670621 RepID=A0ABW1NXC9_9PSEU
MTTTSRIAAGLATAGLVAAAAVLTAVPATAASKGSISIYNNCGRAVSTTIHRLGGAMIAGTAAAPAGSRYSYPVYAGGYLVRVPAGQRTVTVLDVPGKVHVVSVKAC